MGLKKKIIVKSSFIFSVLSRGSSLVDIIKFITIPRARSMVNYEEYRN